MPWSWKQAGEGPLGAWLIDFMQKVLQKGLHYTLNAWWYTDQSVTNPLGKEAVAPHTHREGAELWAKLLREWKKRFDFDGLVYVDISNEVPYFLTSFLRRYEQSTGPWYDGGQHFSPAQIEALAGELNPAICDLQREFPEVRFTA